MTEQSAEPGTCLFAYQDHAGGVLRCSLPLGHGGDTHTSSDGWTWEDDDHRTFTLPGRARLTGGKDTG